MSEPAVRHPFLLWQAKGVLMQAIREAPDSVVVTKIQMKPTDLFRDGVTGEDASKVTVTLKVPRRFFQDGTEEQP